MEIGFSHQVKRKQCWGIKINNLKNGIVLGVCLKNIWKKYNFTTENVDINEKKHGSNLIGSNSLCFSHYDQDIDLS